MGKYEQHSRAEWAVVHPNLSDLATPVKVIWIHHTAGVFMPHFDIGLMRNLEAAEIARGGYQCLAYHEMVCGNGAQVESRPPHKKGGATLNQNSISVAICLPGNYETVDNPTLYQRDSMTDIMVGWRLFGIISPDFTVHGHWEEFPTACPGARVKPWVPSLRHEFDVKWAALHDAPAPVHVPVPAPPTHDWVGIWKYRAAVVLHTLRAQQSAHKVLKYNPAHVIEGVKAWQESLNLDMKTRLESDGLFGPSTLKATKSFQAKHGLKQDGIVGDNTRGAMIVELQGKLDKA